MNGHARVLAACALATLTVGLTGGAAGVADGVVNVGYPATSTTVSGDLVAFSVSEFQHGGRDLNEDGDADDAVVFVHDSRTGTTLNLGLATFPFSTLPLEGALLAFSVPEAQQGGRDLNGDGDTEDSVVHLYDAASGVTTNTGLAGLVLQNDGGRIVLLVSESGQGAADLNGDGDAGDLVLHVHDADTGTTTNAGLAVFGSGALTGGHVMVRVTEAGQGGGDLNGDGDATDVVWHVVGESGDVRNLRLAGGSPPQGDDGRFAFLVAEPFQGADLNGDGDADDFVLHVYYTAADRVTNLGFGTGTYALRGALAAFLVSEFGHGGTDLNGDGDASDVVMHTADVRTGAVTNLGVASSFIVSGEPPTNGLDVVVPVSEAGQGGGDLNGDGDALDSVIHVYDSVAGVMTNTRLAGNPLSLRNGAAVGFIVSEQQEGNGDLNGDGDALDSVLHVLDGARAVRNVGLATFDALATDSLFAFAVSEGNQGEDLNGDGDTLDTLGFVHDVRVGATLNLGSVTGPFSFRADGRRIAFGVPEADEGDLNGDGDTGDVVLHTWVAPAVPRDTARIRAEVEGLDSAAFRSRGHRTAMVSILTEVDVLIGGGELDEAIRKLENLRRRLDGCGIAPDADDWIVDCGVQAAVRTHVDGLIAGLRS